MSLDDDLSLSFASSMGIENIQDEYLDRSNLYTDLDQLERSVDAEFEEYMNRARSFPFKQQQDSEALDDDDDDASVRSDYEMVGQDLPPDSANRHVDHEDEQEEEEGGMDDGDNDSWQRYLANRHSDEHYKPLGDPSFSKSQSRSTSPGEYFGARSSLPFDHDWKKQIEDDGDDDDDDDGDEQEQEQEEEEEESIDHHIHSSYNRSSSNSSRNRQKTAIQKSLDSRFISLPKSIGIYPKYELPDIELHHPYTQKQIDSNGSSVLSTRQQCSSSIGQRQRQRDLQLQLQHAQSDNSDYHQRKSSSPSSSHASSAARTTSPPLYTIEPSSPLQFLCELSLKTIYAKVIHLRIENTSATSVRHFSLFSAQNMLDFEMSQGLILEHEVVDIKIKIQSSTLAQYQRQHKDNDNGDDGGAYPSLSDKILVLIDHRHVNELDVKIDFIALQDPEEQEEEDKEQQQHLMEHNLLLAHRPKCRFCALEKGYPLYSLQQD